MWLNTGTVPNVKSATNSFFVTRISPETLLTFGQFPQICLTAVKFPTFPGIPDKSSILYNNDNSDNTDTARVLADTCSLYDKLLVTKLHSIQPSTSLQHTSNTHPSIVHAAWAWHKIQSSTYVNILKQHHYYDITYFTDVNTPRSVSAIAEYTNRK